MAHTTIATRFESDIAVVNLKVRDLANFAVGADSLLVHNISWCDYLTRVLGVAKPPALEGVVWHARHIIPQFLENKAGYEFLKKTKEIMASVGLGNYLETLPQKLCFASQKGVHTIESMKAVAKAIETAAAKGGKIEVLRTLDRIGAWFLDNTNTVFTGILK